MQTLPGSINPTLIKIDGMAQNETMEEVERRKKRQTRSMSKVRRAQLRARIAGLYAAENTLSAIVQYTQEEFELDEPLTISNVKYHIQQQVEFWRKEGLKHIDDKKALVLARIDQIEELATMAYFNSMEGRVTHYYEKAIERARAQTAQDKRRERILDKKPKTMLDEEIWAEAGKTLRSRDPQEIIDEDLPDGELPDLLQVTSEKIKEHKRFEETSAGDKGFLQIMLDCAKERSKLWGLYIKDNDQENAESAFAMMSDEDKTNRLATILGTVQKREIAKLAEPGPLPKKEGVNKQLEAGMDEVEQTQEEQRILGGRTTDVFLG